jgi:hypothetical protein
VKFLNLDEMLGIKLIPNHFKMGLVIGTYGTPAYIHLFLESAKRNFSHIPILVHDDCSGCEELKKIVSSYGQEFSTNENHCGHGAGDIQVILGGLRWASSINLDILVKMSRRFIPFFDWTPGLKDTVLKSQHTTFANKCGHFKFPLRSECFGMYVPAWIKKRDELEKLAVNGIKVEQDLMDFIKEFAKPTCYLNENYIAKNATMDYFSQYYGVWSDIGDNRMKVVPDVLWHDCCDISRYIKKSAEYNLPYKAKDFII